MGDPSTSSGAEQDPAAAHARCAEASFSRDAPSAASNLRTSYRSIGRCSAALQPSFEKTLQGSVSNAVPAKKATGVCRQASWILTHSTGGSWAQLEHVQCMCRGA